MQRYLIPIVIILVLASGLLIGCSQSQESNATLEEDNANWTEKQVIEYLWEYLASKAEQLQGVYGESKQLIIGWRFSDEVHEANREALDKDYPDLGDSVDMLFDVPLEGESEPLKTLTWTSALKKIAKYEGDGWWLVTIRDEEWRVNEARKEVVAWNEEATKLLEEVTLKTYHNSRYGYYVDYPPSWTINAEDKNNVLISDDPKDARAFVFIVAIDGETLASFGGLRGYIDARLTSFKNEYYAFEKTNVSYLTIDYKYQKKENSPTNEGRLHTFLNGDMLFEIICSGRIIEVPGKSYFNIYDPFDSFRFQPLPP